MIDPRALELGYETAGHILESVAGRSTSFAVVDLRGDVFWESEIELDREATSAIRRHIGKGVAIEGATFDLGERGQLSFTPILNAEESPLAWLIASSVHEEGDGDARSSLEWKRVCETLPRVSEMLSRECSLASELTSAVNELGDRYEELNIVYRMERQSHDTQPQDEIVRAMFEGFLAHMKIDVGVLMTMGPGKTLEARGTQREIANIDLLFTELKGKIWPFAVALKKPLVMNDLEDERRSYLLTNLPFKLLAIPNESCGEPSGGLLMLRYFDEPDFTNSDMSLAQVFFGQAMILLRNQALLNKMELFTRQIASSLVATVEAKDPYTRGHSERVESITSRLGREAGVPDDDFNDLLWGALLHDIGKIGVPDAILMKPGRLTEDEYTFIKTHPNRSYEILRHVEALGPAALDAARYHQESFDGSGYPFGLVGSEIPLVARIVSIADTYDAITSSRSYRAARSHEKAMQVIQQVAGAQLDPELVRLFVKLAKEDEDWLDEIRCANSGDHDG